MTDNSLSIIIPARGESAEPDKNGNDRHEIFFKRTIEDVLENAIGDIRVFPVIDGPYEPPPEDRVEDSRVEYIRMPIVSETQKRHGINKAVSITDSKYVMSLDAHCLVAKGFDEVLKAYHQDNWIQIPRRHRLDPIAWGLQPQSDERPPIDYEYFKWYDLIEGNGLHGFRWDERTYARWDIMLDDTLEFQGSCWFMTKDYFNHLGLMQIEGYTGWGAEAEELGFKARRDGGRVISNKYTYYAHLHKGKLGRLYHMSKNAINACNVFSRDYWVHENKDTFIKSIDQFWPLPKWPGDWKNRIYG